MNKKKLLIMGCALSIACCLYGCKNTEVNKKADDSEIVNSANKEATYDYFKDIELKDNEEVVYSDYNTRLGVYNLDSKTWQPLYDEYNMFAYGYNREYYTIGNSLYNKFSIIKIEDNVIKNVMDIDEKDSLYPYAEYENDIYFLYCINDLAELSNEEISRKIVKYNIEEKKLEDVMDNEVENINMFVVKQDTIYYYNYIEENENYNLCSYNINTKENKVLVESLSVDQADIYNNQVVYNDSNGYIKGLDSDFSFKLKDKDGVENVIDGDNSLIFEIYVNEERDIECKVSNLGNGQEVATVSNYIGYKVVDKTLYLYCTGKIHEIKL